MPQNIEHIVVLMLENRSFDHMLGFMKRPDYPIDGLNGDEMNPTDPEHPTDLVRVSADAGDLLGPDPGHSFQDINIQLFNNPSGPPPVGPPNTGFVYSYSQQNGVTRLIARNIMKCFDPRTIPVLTSLAMEFAVCDKWFSSVPAKTWPNRFFAHAATSKGYLDNSQFNNYDMPTIFEKLTANGLTWRDYYDDFSQTWALQRLQTEELRVNFRSMSQFRADARNGTLPNYSFIEPKYFVSANDQHPPHSIAKGEELIAMVYNVIRSSPLWESTLLVITHDEHGGTYDHVQPLRATPPDSHTARFAFDRYGVRVPAVLISPFIPPRTIVTTVFDHTSILATLNRVFGLGAPLTARDRDANHFSDVPSLPHARTDTPRSVGSRALDDFPDESITVDELIAIRASGGTSVVPLTDFQEDLVDLARSLDTGESRELRDLISARRIETEFDAEVFVREVAEKFAPTRANSRKR
jgi:phospholipase C